MEKKSAIAALAMPKEAFPPSCKLETRSRSFSKFQEEGYIAVQQKHIRILQVDGLKALLNHRN